MPVSRCRRRFTLAPPLGPSLLCSRRSPPCLRVSGSFSVFKPQLTCHPYHSHLPATSTQICLTFFMSFNYHPSYLTIQLLALQSVFPPAPQHRSSKDGSFYLLYSPPHAQYARRKDWSEPKVQIHFGGHKGQQRTNRSATYPSNGRMSLGAEMASGRTLKRTLTETPTEGQD